MIKFVFNYIKSLFEWPDVDDVLRDIHKKVEKLNKISDRHYKAGEDMMEQARALRANAAVRHYRSRRAKRTAERFADFIDVDGSDEPDLVGE